jgi:PAS domain S-box-containing protein
MGTRIMTGIDTSGHPLLQSKFSAQDLTGMKGPGDMNPVPPAKHKYRPQLQAASIGVVVAASMFILEAFEVVTTRSAGMFWAQTITIIMVSIFTYLISSLYLMREAEYSQKLGRETDMLRTTMERETALLEQLRIFEHTFYSAGDAINIADLDDNLILVNPAFCKMYGYEAHDVIGKKSSLLWSPTNPPELVSTILPSTLESSWSGELYNKRSDGTEFPVHLMTSAIKDREGKVIALVGIARDVSYRLHIEDELRRYNADLQARNEELDTFSRAVAHDLKSPIGTVLNFAELLRQDYADVLSKEVMSHVMNICWGAGKTLGIIDELLLLAGLRRRLLEIQPVDMQTIVNNVLRRLDVMITRHHAEVHVSVDLPVAKGYAPWIEEAFANYVSNAVKYGGHPPVILIGGELVDRGMVRFWVRDNGPGVDTAHIDKLFLPFVRVGDLKVEGDGLGLSIVRDIIHRFGGEVGARSLSTGGSEFFFTLPEVDPVSSSSSQG